MANQDEADRTLTPQALSPELTNTLASHAARIIEIVSSDDSDAAEFMLTISRGVAKETWRVYVEQIPTE